MNKTLKYIYPLLIVFALVGCKTKDKTTLAKPSKGSNEIQPEDVKPAVDTRFQEAFFAAQLEKAKNNHQKAYALFEECLDYEPKSASAHYELGRLDLAIFNNPTNALNHAKTSVAEEPKNAWYHTLLADIYMASAKYELAVKSYREAAKLNPDDPNTLYQIAAAQLYSGQYKEVIATYNELEKKSGPFEELSIQKHQIFDQLKDYENAVLELEKLARSFPDESRYWGMLSQYSQKIGKMDKAKWAMEEMVKYDPDNGQVHFQLSEYYAALGQDQKSFEELLLAFKSTDVSIDQKVGILLRYFSLTEIKESYKSQAYELLDLAEKTHPMEAKSYSIYGDFLYRDGKGAEALVKYKKASTLDASKNLIWEQILFIESELSLFDEMARDSDEAIEIFPNQPQFYFYNGVANERLKNYSKAISSLQLGKELVVDNDPLLARFYSSLGDIYHQIKEHTKSDENYEKALKINPDNTYVLNNYAYYLSIRKVNLDKAEIMAAKANKIEPGNASFEDTYAWVLYQKANYKEALIWIEKALSRGIASAELFEHSGDILFQLNRIEDAVSRWKEAVKTGETSPALEQKIVQRKIIE